MKLFDCARATLATSVLSLLMVTRGVCDDGQHSEQELVRQALERGEIIPLTRVLEIASQRIPGSIIKIDLEHGRQGAIVYDIKVLSRSGQVRKINIDARTGVVLKIKDD